MKKKLKSFICLFKNELKKFKNWQTLIIFILVMVIVGSEVWVSYLIAIIVGLDTPLGASLSTFATACLIFWNLPFTPFLLVCFTITTFIVELKDKIKKKRNARQ